MDTESLVLEILKFNPSAKQTEIARALGISRQRVFQILQKLPRASKATEKWRPRYEDEVAYARKTIPERGRLWEGCRHAFESGEYYNPNLTRMLKEGVIIPAADDGGGYILPSTEEG